MKYLELSVCMSAALGAVIGNIWHTPPFAPLFPLALFFMLWPIMLDVELWTIGNTFTERNLAIPLILNFIVSPLLIFWLSRLFLPDASRSATIGLLLFGMMPAGGMAPAYTGMAGGNVELSLAVMAISLLLSIGAVPIWTDILIAQSISVPPLLAVKATTITILLPMFFAMILRECTLKVRGREGFQRMKSAVRKVPGYGLLLLVFISFAVNGSTISKNPFLVVQIGALAAAFLMMLLLSSGILSKMSGLCRADTVAVMISSTAKNNAISLSLAALLFGPETILTVAIAGFMVQLPIMLGFVRLFR